MSMSKGVLGVFSALVGAIVSAGIIIPSTSDAPTAAVNYSLSTTSAAVDAVAKVSEELSTQDPLLPDDPAPPPKPTPTPRPTPTKIEVSPTIGCQFPPIYDKWWLRPTDQAAHLVGLVEDPSYRTNLMFNWEGQFQHKIKAISASGVVLGSLSFDTYLLEPCTPDNVTYRDGVCSGMFQLNQFIQQIDASYTGVYSVQVTPLGGTGKAFFYATTIDNKSSDCITYTQFRTTSKGNMWAESGLYNLVYNYPEVGEP